MNIFKVFVKKYAAISALLILFLFIVIAFLSNSTLQFLFKNKVWAHKVNSIEKLDEASKLFPGAELDAVFYAKGNYFEVNHPPDKSINLSLTDYFKSLSNNHKYKYWIDFKNLNEENEVQSSNTLDSITKLVGITNSHIIVESMNPQFLKSFRDKGFFTSYYLPEDLCSMNADILNETLDKIKTNIRLYDIPYISANYKDYPIIKTNFPDKKILTWFTVYGSMNKISARILLYKILCDENVEVLLIPFHSKKGNR